LAPLNLHPDASFTVLDLLSNEQFLWHGSRNYVSLTPHGKQAHILQITRNQVTETDYLDF
jgi:hypothetical protein